MTITIKDAAENIRVKIVQRTGSDTKSCHNPIMPREWEGTEDLPLVPLTIIEIAALTIFIIAAITCAYFIITTDIGMSLFLALIQGIAIGVATAAFLSLATRI